MMGGLTSGPPHRRWAVLHVNSCGFDLLDCGFRRILLSELSASV